jgi:SAM-dependent methyltransferase
VLLKAGPVLLTVMAATIGTAAIPLKYTFVLESIVSSNEGATPARAPAASTVTIPLDEVKTILSRLGEDVPAELTPAAAAFESKWADWVARHHADMRARLDRGDLDSIVNFWLYGTTFTRLPRVTAEELRKPGGVDRAEELLLRRLTDLTDAMAKPQADVRLQFARETIQRHGIDVSTRQGQERARLLLASTRNQTVADNARYRSRLQAAGDLDPDARLAAYGVMYQDRGLSSDTSLGVDFALAAALRGLKTAGVLSAGAVKNVAIVGPGLDFTDKAEGHDFYPPQTTQPFALIDSLCRLELSHSNRIRVVAFDINRRVTDHIASTQKAGVSGTPYTLQVPLDRSAGTEWTSEFVEWWKQFGRAIGEPAPVLTPPSGSAVNVRAVRVRAAVAASVLAQELDIVVERMAPAADAEGFDLIVATNVLVYYSRFEQALALANIAHMLRPGGVLLTNYLVRPLPPMEARASLRTAVSRDQKESGDTIFTYRRLSPEAEREARAVERAWLTGFAN